MSDQESNNNNQHDQKPEPVTPVAEKPEAPRVAAASERPSIQAAGKGSTGIAWLALLSVVALGLAVAWLAREGQYREQALVQRLDTLAAESRREQTNLDQLGDRLRGEWRPALDALQKTQENATSQLSQRLDAEHTTLAQLQEELARFSASDRNSWLLAEAGHLLRLANQRLVMAGDPVASLALLDSADAVLREIDDPTLHPVRAALAADTAALRAVPKVDVEGIYLRLAALDEQVGKLVIFQLPAPPARVQPEAADDWRSRLRQGYQAALARLSDYLVIRRRDVPVQALMDPQWEGLVRQNLRMLLEQAQVALLSSNQFLYTESLQRAQEWVAQFIDSDEAAARAISAELTQLAGLTVGVPQPDISRSLLAMDAAIEQRLHTQGGE